MSFYFVVPNLKHIAFQTTYLEFLDRCTADVPHTYVGKLWETSTASPFLHCLTLMNCGRAFVEFHKRFQWQSAFHSFCVERVVFRCPGMSTLQYKTALQRNQQMGSPQAADAADADGKASEVPLTSAVNVLVILCPSAARLPKFTSL